jgi:hypothetical protein
MDRERPEFERDWYKGSYEASLYRNVHRDGEPQKIECPFYEWMFMLIFGFAILVLVLYDNFIKKSI